MCCGCMLSCQASLQRHCAGSRRRSNEAYAKSMNPCFPCAALHSKLLGSLLWRATVRQPHLSLEATFVQRVLWMPMLSCQVSLQRDYEALSMSARVSRMVSKNQLLMLLLPVCSTSSNVVGLFRCQVAVLKKFDLPMDVVRLGVCVLWQHSQT